MRSRLSDILTVTMMCELDPGGFLALAVVQDGDTDYSVRGSADSDAANKIAELERRILRLEARRTEAARRALRDLRESAASSWRFRWVPKDYYDMSMEERSRLLACNVRQMCKSVLLENKNWKGDNEFARENAHHYLVVVQYAATLSENKLRDALAKLAGKSKSSFHLRFATPEANARLSGYESGGVTPFGMLERRVPVVLADAASRAPGGIIWMGGGHRDLKLGCAVTDFVRTFDPIVVDASEPRDSQFSKAGVLATYEDDDDTAASRLALVVGRIIDVWEHPKSEKLFCERVDCGTTFGSNRHIASGLRAHMTETDLRGRRCLVCANLKTLSIAGFESQGMLLCATQDDPPKVVLVEPPPDAQPGDRVALPGLPNPYASVKECDKLKLFAKAQSHFIVQNSVVYYKKWPFLIPGHGSCTARVKDGAKIS